MRREGFVIRLYCHGWEPSAAVPAAHTLNTLLWRLIWEPGPWSCLLPAFTCLLPPPSPSPSPLPAPPPAPQPTSYFHLDASEQMWTEPYAPWLWLTLLCFQVGSLWLMLSVYCYHLQVRWCWWLPTCPVQISLSIRNLHAMKGIHWKTNTKYLYLFI